MDAEATLIFQQLGVLDGMAPTRSPLGMSAMRSTM